MDESAELTGLHMVMVANTAPWTYLGARPIGPFPRASFDHGLDLYGLRTLADDQHAPPGPAGRLHVVIRSRAAARPCTVTTWEGSG